MTEPIRLSKRDAARRETETRILDAAEKVFAEAGFGGATMQLIADMAGLPKANLHYYFATKEELYRKVVQQIFEIWLHAADSFDNAPGPVEGIGAYIDAKMDISRRHPFGSKGLGERGDAWRAGHSGLSGNHLARLDQGARGPDPALGG